MICTRSDLAYAISLVSRFMSNSGKEHWLALKWILRYVKGSINMVLSFSGCEETNDMISGYVDLNFAGSIDTRKSLTGYVFTFHGTVVSWKSMLQPVVALSTTEAKYISITEGVKEGLWYLGFLNELGFIQESEYIS